MQKSHHLPDIERLSILSATILLAYALARFINLPFTDVTVQLPGFYFSVDINFVFFITLVVAGLTAAGADWLLRDHPAIQQHHLTVEHWLLPGLTALVIGIPLLQVPPGPIWWIGFLFGGGLLMGVLLAEYIVFDSTDAYQPLAASALSAISFALYLILAVTLRYSDLRLFLTVPALTLAAWLVSLRTIRLRQGQWAFLETGVLSLIAGQWATALYYLPLSAISFGLILLGPTYSLSSLISSLLEGKALRQSVLEPVIVLILVWGAAVWLR